MCNLQSHTIWIGQLNVEWLDKCLIYPPWLDPFRLRGHVDDHKSASDYIYIFVEGSMMWKSKKRAIVAQSSIEAEYVVPTLVVKGGIWLKAILEINLFEIRLEINCDNQSCIKLVSNPRMIDNIRHISFKVAFPKGFNWIQEDQFKVYAINLHVGNDALKDMWLMLSLILGLLASFMHDWLSQFISNGYTSKRLIS
mgnify:CR=1 FL=1